MAETMKDYEAELEASFKKIEEGDILTGIVVSVDDKEIIVDLKYYAEGIIPVEDYSREPGFNVKEEVHPGDEVSATVIRKDDGNGNILLSKVEATDVLAWDKLKELKASGEVLDVVVKGVVNGGAVAYVEGVRGFIPASKLALNYVEDANEYLNRHIQVQVIDVNKEDKKLIPAGNLIEIKFEDFESNALEMTQKIYETLSLPGFKEAEPAIRKYLDKKKGYKKNAYQYDPRTVELVEKNWGFALKQWGYQNAE